MCKKKSSDEELQDVRNMGKSELYRLSGRRFCDKRQTLTGAALKRPYP